MYVKDTLDRIADRREMLRVKIKSLAAEAGIIRREEHRQRFDRRGRARGFGPIAAELQWHRTGVVREEARLAHIAYALVRGRDADTIEPNGPGLTAEQWKRVRAMLVKYGPAAYAERVANEKRECPDALRLKPVVTKPRVKRVRQSRELAAA